MVENQKQTKFVTKIPTISEHLLRAPLISYGDDNGGKPSRDISVDDSLIICFAGARGSGKSLSLSYAAMKALAIGLPVWLNYPLKFNIKRPNDKIELLEARKLDFNDLFSLSPNIQGGVIGIDEYQEWAPSQAFMTTQNRVLNAFWAQIRKNSLSFYYCSKFMRRVDGRTREETDIEIICQDAAKTNEGFGKYKDGQIINWYARDLSGAWTGFMFELMPINYEFNFEARMIWGAFDTRFRFDIIEAMKGVKMDLTKKIITDKEEIEFSGDGLEFAFEQLIQQKNTWLEHEIWSALGITAQRDKTKIKGLLTEKGYKPNWPGGQRGWLAPAHTP